MKITNLRNKAIILAIITVFPALCFTLNNLDQLTNYHELPEEVFNYPKISWDYGNGSIGNPRMLENKTFVGTGSNGYYLYDTTFYFIIRNCTFIDSGTADDNAGLKLVAVQNGIITNNSFSSCQNGIYFAGQLSKQCKNNLVYDNNFVGNIKGVALTTQAKDINITHNHFSNNIDGVEVGGGCDGIDILYNNFTSDNTGITVMNAQDNLLGNNKIVGSSFSAIYLTYGGSHIVKNNILRNSDIGILFDHASLNMCDKNEIENNDIGIRFQYLADDNTFYNNTMTSNTIQGEISNSYSNSFSYNGYGNSWDDYDGYDCNNDGIGETPYVSGSITDNYPLCSRLDTFDPIVSIVEPIADSEYFSNPPSFTITIQEYLIQSRWYTVDGEYTQYPFTGLTGTINQPLWEGLALGDHYITFYVRDRAGNIGSDTVYITKKQEEEPEPAIPFGSYYLIVIFISVISALFILRKSQNQLYPDISMNTSNLN